MTCHNKLKYPMSHTKIIMQSLKYQKMQFCIQLYLDIWEIILYLQANPHRPKTKNINILIFIGTFIE